MSTTDRTPDRRIADEQHADVDLSQTVYLGGKRYHADWDDLGHGCPNPNYDLEKGTLREAIEQGLTDCRNCEPLDNCGGRGQ